MTPTASLFIDAANRNYRLQVGSPAIDKGGAASSESDTLTSISSRGRRPGDRPRCRRVLNLPPCASGVGVEASARGSRVKFDASGSVDPEGATARHCQVPLGFRRRQLGRDDDADGHPPLRRDRLLQRRRPPSSDNLEPARRAKRRDRGERRHGADGQHHHPEERREDQAADQAQARADPIRRHRRRRVRHRGGRAGIRCCACRRSRRRRRRRRRRRPSASIASLNAKNEFLASEHCTTPLFFKVAFNDGLWAYRTKAATNSGPGQLRVARPGQDDGGVTATARLKFTLTRERRPDTRPRTLGGRGRRLELPTPGGGRRRPCPSAEHWSMPLTASPATSVLEVAAGPGDTGFLAAELIHPGGAADLHRRGGADGRGRAGARRAARDRQRRVRRDGGRVAGHAGGKRSTRAVPLRLHARRRPAGRAARGAARAAPRGAARARRVGRARAQPAPHRRPPALDAIGRPRPQIRGHPARSRSPRRPRCARCSRTPASPRSTSTWSRARPVLPPIDDTFAMMSRALAVAAQGPARAQPRRAHAPARRFRRASSSRTSPRTGRVAPGPDAGGCGEPRNLRAACSTTTTQTSPSSTARPSPSSASARRATPTP